MKPPGRHPDHFYLEVDPQNHLERRGLYLVIHCRTYAAPNYPHHETAVNAIALITPLQFLAMFTELGLDSYRFSATGNGCRYWCLKTAMEFARIGWLQPNAGALVDQYMNALAQAYPNLVPLGAQHRGKFAFELEQEQ